MRCGGRLGALEADWLDRFGPEVIQTVRAALEPLTVGEPAPLFGAIEPYPDNWRAVCLARPSCPATRWSCTAGAIRTAADAFTWRFARRPHL